MSTSINKILFVNNDPADFELASGIIKRKMPDLKFEYVNGLESFKEKFKKGTYLAVITEYDLPPSSGLEVLKYTRSIDPDTVAVITGDISKEKDLIYILDQEGSDQISKNSIKKLPIVLLRLLKQVESNKLREAAIQKLKESERKYFSILQNSSIAFFLTTTNGLIIDANEAAIEMFGYDLEELRKIGRKSIIDDKDPDFIKLLKLREKKGKVEGECTGIHKSGKRFTCEFASTMFKDINGEDRTSTTIIDISERKNSEVKLKNSQVMWDSLVQNTNDTILIISLDNLILYANKLPASLNEKGQTTEKIIGKDYTSFVAASFLPLVKGQVEYSVKNNVTTSFLMQGSVSNLYYECTATPIVKENKVDGLIIILKDITTLIIARNKIRENEEKFRKIINSTDEIFYVIKVEKIKSHINPITYLSPQTEFIFGVSPEEITDRPEIWYDSIHPEDKISVNKVSRLLFLNKEPVTRTYRIKKFNNNEFIWVEDYISPILDENGEIKELYGSIKDVTILKNKEKELERLLNELSNKYNELMQFNYIVSHNLRSPIANIIGLSNVMSLPNVTKEEKIEIIENIKHASIKLDELVKDLSVVLSTRSAINTRKEKVNVGHVLNNIIETLKTQISESNGELRIDISQDANELYTIKSYLESILYNLVNNALKYKTRYHKPIITVSTKKVEDGMIIVVADNGIGIDMEAHGTNVFGLYKRFNMEVEGKGLGLYMTKTQVEVIGGKITLESKLDMGTTFTIFIPDQLS